MKSLIQSIWHALALKTQRQRRVCDRKRSMRLEQLEERYNPSGITLSAGVITITGSDKADVSKVELVTNDNESVLDDRYKVSISNPSGSLTLPWDSAG